MKYRRRNQNCPESSHIGQRDGAFSHVGGEDKMADTLRRWVEGVQLIFKGDHGVEDEDANGARPALAERWILQAHHLIEQVVDRRPETRKGGKLR